MQFKDILIALLVILLWSMSLVIQKLFSQSIPLEFFNLLRFIFCIPFLFFLKKPQISFPKLLLVAFFWNVVSFFMIGLSMHYGTGVGLISVVYQTCVFFGVFFCFLFIKEIPKIHQIAGMVLSFSGVVLLFNNSIVVNSTQSVTGLLFVILAAISWGLGITFIKKYKLSCDISTNAWLASISALPMLLVNLMHGGSASFMESLRALSFEMVMGILFTTLGPTLFAGCAWFGLLKKYPSSLVTPFMLLLPPVSCIASYFFFGEHFTPLQLFAFLIIFLGVSVNQSFFYNSRLAGLLPAHMWKKWISTN